MLPTWIIWYRTRRPTLTAPLAHRDYAQIEVSAMDRDGAAAAFRQRYHYEIVSISIGSPTGMA